MVTYIIRKKKNYEFTELLKNKTTPSTLTDLEPTSIPPIEQTVFDDMPAPECLGASHPRLALYLPHRPNGLAQLVEVPSAQALIAANSNHWRKIVTLLAKIASPIADEWRRFRDEDLFRQTALCFEPRLNGSAAWHWIGGKDNLQRFDNLHHNAQPLPNTPEVLIDAEKQLLLTPYPDYRQLSNTLVSKIRAALGDEGFYSE